MKRTIDIVAVVGLTAVFIAGLWNPLWAPTYTYVRKEVANTWTSIQTFSGGASSSSLQLTASTTTAAPMDVFMRRDADTGCVLMFEAARQTWQLCPTYAVPPPCPADTSGMPQPSLCFDVQTNHLKYRGVLEQIIP